MKPNLFLTLSLTTLLINLDACSGSVETTQVKNIDMAGHISEGECNNLSELLDVVSVITPEFTDSTMIMMPKRIEVQNNKITIQDRKRSQFLMAFDATTGKSLKVLDRGGQGPEEYTTIVGWDISNDDKWAILDFSQNILEYDFNGSFINRHSNDTIFSLWHLPSNKWVARTNIKANALNAVVYDSDWNTVATIPSGIVWSKAEKSNNFDNFISDFLNDNHYYLMPNDTILQLDEKSMNLHSYLILNYGKFSLPEFKSTEQWMKIRENGYKEYIVIRSQPVFNDKYLFISYNYGGNMYFDTYNILEDKLVFRGIANENNQVFGIPIKLPQGEVHGWPLYSLDNKFYFMVPDFEAEGVLYENDLTNPPIIEIKIKG